MADIIRAIGFKKALELFEQGRIKEGKVLLQSLQDEYVALCSENDILKKQLGEVADVLNLAEKVEYDGQKYWLIDGGERKGPFCQLCYDRDGQLVNLQPQGQHWECQNCKSMYMTPNQQNEPSKSRTTIKTTLKKTIPLFLERELG